MRGVSFEQALEANPAPRSVGDVRLRYEESLLIGETRPHSSLLAPALLVAGIGSALAALAALLVTGQIAGAAILAGGGGLLVAGSAYLDQRARGVRRFILNFATESLRLESPRRLGAGARTHIVPFDAVKDVTVDPAEGGRFSLRVRFELPGKVPPPELLVDGAPPGEVEELRRLWKTLRAAFGLS